MLPSLLPHYLKVALRHLTRHPGYALINVTGLAAGIACCVLLLLFVRDELRFDRHYAHADRIYRLVADIQARGEDPPQFVFTSIPAAPALAAAFPEIEAAVRFYRSTGVTGAPVLRATDGPENRPFAEPELLFADPGVLSVFGFPFDEGDPATALGRPDALVLTASTARKHFGAASPLGRAVHARFGDAERTLTVTGVLADLPSATHLKFDALVSFETLLAMAPVFETAWNSPLAHTYLLLRAGTDPATFAAKLPGFVQQHIGPPHFPRTYYLEALPRIHLHSQRYGGLRPGGSIVYVYVFSAIALFILLLACINFVNLTTARAARRAREVGLRKVLGASPARVARQFLGESVLLAVAALGLGVALSLLGLPLLGALAGKPLAPAALLDGPLLAVVAGIGLFVGLVAGSYPAFYLSAFQPLAVLRGRAGGGRGARLRKGLVVFQFVVSIALLAATAVVHDQLQFFRSKPLGFDRAHVVVLPAAVGALGERYEAFGEALRRHPNVEHVAASFGVPGHGVVGLDYWIEGTPPEAIRNVVTFLADYDFVETYGFTVTAGRAFSRAFPADGEDTGAGVLINETAARTFGWDDPVGRQVHWMQPTGSGYEVARAARVVGVVGDFHAASLSQPIQPMIFQLATIPPLLKSISIRIRPERVPETMAFVEATWQQFAPGSPFESFFLDAHLDAQYESEERLGRLFLAFGGLAVGIACLGLLGLAAFAAEQRRREIGVRKVLGASAAGIALLLVKEFAALVALAFVLAAPLAAFGLHRWLEGFAYRTPLSWLPFAMAGTAALAIALATVGYQALRAALTNPVKVLRSE